jgi:hypothetical protein
MILDEHGGTGGSPDPAFRQMVTDFYMRHGFRLFERAYSRHFHTVNAIPDILNFGAAGESRTVSKSLDIGRTSYLSALGRSGYQLRLYQSNFADFCRYHSFETCTSAWGPSLSFVKDEPLPINERARLIALKFADMSSAAVLVADIIDDVTELTAFQRLGIPQMTVKTAAVSDSLGGFALLQRIASDVSAAKPGQAYFAHVLAPHFPYVRSRDCNFVLPSRWLARRSVHEIEARREAYRSQVACVMRHLETIVRNFQASPGGKNGIIIVHGDHGSRITALDPEEVHRNRISPADLMAGYSSLFAVRSPTISVGIDRVPQSSPLLLKRLAETGFRSVDGLPPGDNQVFLDGHYWRVGGMVSIARAWPQ